MKKYYIQFSTDFHLLASLASIEDFSSGNIVLFGPRTRTAVLIAEKISAELVVVDPRSPRLKLGKMLPVFVRSRVCKDSVIISPFVFPFYVFLRLLSQGVLVRNIVRTDEGVGSYASILHYYESIKLESPEKSKFQCMLKAIIKKMSVWLTKRLCICREKYIFNKDLTVDPEGCKRLKRNIDMLGRLDKLDERVVYVSQPGISNNFTSAEEYSSFIRKMGRRGGLGDVVIKKHPSDSFDYSSHGFEVVEGFPLELYNVERSFIIGFSSTALLMAKIIGGCDRVYYVKKMQGDGPFICNLSLMNQRLFEFYLEPLEPAC